MSQLLDNLISGLSMLAKSVLHSLTPLNQRIHLASFEFVLDWLKGKGFQIVMTDSEGACALLRKGGNAIFILFAARLYEQGVKVIPGKSAAAWFDQIKSPPGTYRFFCDLPVNATFKEGEPILFDPLSFDADFINLDASGPLLLELPARDAGKVLVTKEEVFAQNLARLVSSIKSNSAGTKMFHTLTPSRVPHLACRSAREESYFLVIDHRDLLFRPKFYLEQILRMNQGSQSQGVKQHILVARVNSSFRDGLSRQDLISGDYLMEYNLVFEVENGDKAVRFKSPSSLVAKRLVQQNKPVDFGFLEFLHEVRSAP